MLSGFYKDDGSEVLLYAPNFVQTPNTLITRQNYTQPVEGWTYYGSISDAYAAAGKPVPGQDQQAFVQALTPPDWEGFNARLLSDPVLNTAIGKTLGIAPVLAVSLPAALSQVAENGVSSFQLVFNSVAQIGGITSQQRQEFAAIAELHNLPGDFIKAVRGS